MTQKRSEPFSHPLDGSEFKHFTRIEDASSDLIEPSKPRLGRRESEPHSAEVTYIRDVLTTNFPAGRALWDLHHYFIGTKGALKGNEIDVQFDVSFFKDLKIPYAISSYDASKHGGRIPDMAINILSKSTWSKDLSETVDICKDIGISVYVVFSPYKVTSNLYKPPFLRAFLLKEDGSYEQKDLLSITLKEGEPIDEKNIIDVREKLPIRLGLMQMNYQYEGEQPLFRLIFIDSSEPRILLSTAEKAAQEAEAKIKELEKDLVKYRKKFGELD